MLEMPPLIFLRDDANAPLYILTYAITPDPGSSTWMEEQKTFSQEIIFLSTSSKVYLNQLPELFLGVLSIYC